jgi:hypothetical protein
MAGFQAASVEAASVVAASVVASVMREAVKVAAPRAFGRQQVLCERVLGNEDLLFGILTHVLWCSIRDDDYPFTRLKRMAFVARRWFVPVTWVMVDRRIEAPRGGSCWNQALVFVDPVLESLYLTQPERHCEYFQLMHNCQPLGDSKFMGGPEVERSMVFENKDLCIGPSWTTRGAIRFIRTEGLDLDEPTLGDDLHLNIENLRDTTANNLLIDEGHPDGPSYFVGSCSLHWKGPAQFVRLVVDHPRPPSLVPLHSHQGWVALVCDTDEYDDSEEARAQSITILINTRSGLQYVIEDSRFYSMRVLTETVDSIAVEALDHDCLWNMSFEVSNGLELVLANADLVHSPMNSHGCICRDGTLVCHPTNQEWLCVWREYERRRPIQFPTEELRAAASYSDCTTIRETSVSGVVLVELDHYRAHWSVVVNIRTGKVLQHHAGHRRRPRTPNMFDCGF